MIVLVSACELLAAPLNTFHHQAQLRFLDFGSGQNVTSCAMLCYENTPPSPQHRESVIFAAYIFANVLKYDEIVYVGLPSDCSNSQDCPGSLALGLWLVTLVAGENFKTQNWKRNSSWTTEEILKRHSFNKIKLSSPSPSPSPKSQFQVPIPSLKV